METLTQVLAGGYALVNIFNLVKPFVEAWFVKPDAALHDPVMRVVVVVLGALAAVASLALGGAVLDAPTVGHALVYGGAAGLAAIGQYHLVPGTIIAAKPKIGPLVASGADDAAEAAIQHIALPASSVGQRAAS